MLYHLIINKKKYLVRHCSDIYLYINELQNVKKLTKTLISEIMWFSLKYTDKYFGINSINIIDLLYK